MTNHANIGVVGLAVMGSNLARNLASRTGNRVAIYNRSVEKTRELAAAHPEAGFVATATIAEFAAQLTKPRAAIIMVQAGAATDAVISQLADAFEPGDIIIDGGNAHFRDTIRREKDLAQRGLHFVGAGISGGEEGALTGPSIMPGGTAEAYRTIGPILGSIAAVVASEPCVTHIGSDGAGHFVKMIHNGIEYADMQLIAEAYDILRRVGGLSNVEIAKVFKDWNQGELESYLIEITAEVLAHADAATGSSFIDIVKDAAGSKGTGVWTVQTALDLGVPASAIAEAVFARALSSQSEMRSASLAAYSASESPKTGSPIASNETLVSQVRQALYASKIIAYTQGFDVIRAGAREHNWSIDLAEVARIWRGGCIIRAQFLNRITDAYRASPQLISMLFDDYFVAALGSSAKSWREVVALAAQNAIPVPAFSAALTYFDGLKSDRLPAALIQGQRDFFGAHTYQRTDRQGSFHTNWSGDRTEQQLG
jgi:6-phosphogluconate dehydrogenase